MSRMIIFGRSILSNRLGFMLAASILTICAAADTINPAKAENATAENTVIETNAATYALKRIELHGTSLTNADLTALLDSNSTTPESERLAKLSASEIIIPEITVTTKSTPIQKITYQNVKLTNVRQGKADAADMDGVQFSVTDEKAGNVDGGYGHVHTQAVDLTLASRIMSEARKAESEPLSTVYESFSIDDFKLNTSGKEPVTLTIAKMTGGNVKGRPFATRPSDFKISGDDPNELASVLKDFLTSFEMHDLTATNIALQSTSEGQPVSISLAKMSINSVGDAKIADIDFGSFAMKIKGSSIELGDVDFKGLDFQKLRDFAPKPKDKDADSDEDDNKPTKVFAPAVSQFIIDKINVSIADENSAVPAIKVAFSIDHFEVNGGAPIDSTPTHVTSSLDHFILDLASLKDQDVKPLTDMGYSKLDISSHMEMTWNADAEELTIKDISVNSAGMGVIKLGALAENVTKDFFSGDSATMQAAALGVQIKKIEFQIDNAGLFEKAMTMQAKAQNKSIEEIKKSYVTTAAIGIPAMLDNKPAAKIVGAALAKFLANPKSFHLVATSATGLGAADFALAPQPSALLDTLEVKATANE